MTSHPSRHVSDSAGNISVRRMQSFAELVLGAWERWMAINLDAARTAYAATSVTARALVDEAVRTQVAAYEEGMDSLADYVRNMNDLCMRTHASMARMNADTMIESTGSMPAFLEQVGTAGPHAAFDAIAMLESAVSNGSAVYEKMLQAGRDMADSNIAAAARAFQPRLPAPARAGRMPRRAA